MTPTHTFASSLIPPPKLGRSHVMAYQSHIVDPEKTKNEWDKNPWPGLSASFVGSAYDAAFLALHVEAKLISAPGSKGERDVVILANLCGNRKP